MNAPGNWIIQDPVVNGRQDLDAGLITRVTEGTDRLDHITQQ